MPRLINSAHAQSMYRSSWRAHTIILPRGRSPVPAGDAHSRLGVDCATGDCSMQIAFAASESTPLAKTGGLADVVGALPPELVKLGHQVTVYLPFYARIRQRIEGEPKYAVRSITIPFSTYNRFAGVVDGGKRDGVQYYFIDCPELFDRKELYGAAGVDYADNAERFGLFCRAVIEASKRPRRARRLPRSRLAGRAHSRLSAHHLPRRSRFAQRGRRAHHSQCRVPGKISAQYHRATPLSLGTFHHGQGGAVRSLQLFEGRRGLFRFAHYGEPQICRGDPDRRVRRTAGRRTA